MGSLIATGATNQAIAATLIIGTSTVKTHVNSIFRSLEAATRFGAVARARRLGLLADV